MPHSPFPISRNCFQISLDLGIRRLGLDLVLWRDAEGRVVCQSRYGPHRGVDLALGQISNQTGQSCLECPYHGFQFASDGGCVLDKREHRN